MVRKIAQEKWQIKKKQWELNSEGFGTVIYQIQTPNNIYHLVLFCDKLEDSERNDRVIASKWDITFALVRGDVSESFLQLLQDNVPLQEVGRTNANVLVLSRANKSVRVFNNIVTSLANRVQPDATLLAEVGYILRTTAVYGNGKFAIADFASLQDNDDFSQSFSAQMCAVFVLRQFSLDLIHYLSKQKNKDAICLDKKWQRFLGVGNATGLGMAPYLINHPKVVDNWLFQRESALAKVTTQIISHKSKLQMLALLGRANRHLSEVVTINEQQKKLNLQASQDIANMAHKLEKEKEETKTWQIWMTDNENCGLEANEVFISCLLELYPSLVDEFARKMNTDEELASLHGLSIQDILDVLRKEYQWCINIDFNKQENTHWFWYVSEDKEEPRLGMRRRDKGAHLELPLDIARQVKQLFDEISLEPTNALLSEFLCTHPHLRATARRVWTMGNSVMGEIQANVIAEEFLPIHILRAKLSILGATKFDPRSDRWVRVTFFQNAPLCDEAYEDDWLWPIVPKLEDNPQDETLQVSHNEIIMTCTKAIYGLRKAHTEADLIAQMVACAELSGLKGVLGFAQALPYLQKEPWTTPKIQELGNGQFELDLDNASILCYSPNVFTYFVDKISKNPQEQTTLTITNCHNRLLCLSEVAKLASKSFFVVASWEDKSEKISCVFSANSLTPDIFIEPIAQAINQNLVIRASKKEIPFANTKHPSFAKQDIIQSTQKLLTQGIVVNAHSWNSIKQYAKNILVPNDENSAKDAGE